MDVDAPSALLGGISPQQFMRRVWQRRPLLVRQALPGFAPPAGRSALFALAGNDDVESRLVVREDDGRWRVRHGPLPRRTLPPLAQPGWTLLVQGVDLHVQAAHELLQRFRFAPDARLDDLMVSWASDGGGVGAHLDAYDVFLLQARGRRRWRVGRVPRPRWRDDTPLKMLAAFEPEHEWIVEPGDLLYLPPRWGHDGVALGGDCMTCSIGFRAPAQDELAAELLPRLADAAGGRSARYADRHQPATAAPAALPAALLDFALGAVQRAAADRRAVARCLGEALTEPKPRVWFAACDERVGARGVVLDRRTRMIYDMRHLYVNGESFAVSGRDAALLRRLADERSLSARHCAALGAAARAAIDEWAAAGWLHATTEAP